MADSRSRGLDADASDIDLPGTEASVKEQKDSKGSKIRDLIASAQEKLDKGNSLLSDVENVIEDSETVVAGLLAPMKDVAVILGYVAELHPYLKIIAGVAKTIIDMELNRRENDKQITAVCFTMARVMSMLNHCSTNSHLQSSLLFLLSDLDAVFDEGNHVHKLLVDRLNRMHTSIIGFANLRECVILYTLRPNIFPDCSQASTTASDRSPQFPVKTLKSTGYKAKLAGYTQEFSDHKQELRLLLSVKSSLTVKDIKIDTEKIINMLEAQSAKEESMERLISSMGGLDVIVKSDQRLEELAERFGEKLDPAMKSSLRKGLDEVLKNNLEAFTNKVKLSLEQMHDAQSVLLVKMDQSTSDVTKQLDYSTSAIISKVRADTQVFSYPGDDVVPQLDSGPHEDIEDPEIKAVWKGSDECQDAHIPRCSVAAIDNRSSTHDGSLAALHNHYQRVFDEHRDHTGQEHPDIWALYFLSKAYCKGRYICNLRFSTNSFQLVRPAIGDGMDEDCSGFKSLPEGPFSTCHSIFIYEHLSWAVGPYKTDVEYLRKIRVLRARLIHAPETVLPKNKNRVTHLAGIVPLLKLIEVYDDVLSSLGEKLRLVWCDLESRRIQSNLETLEYQLKGPDYVSLVLGGRRLENHIMALAYILLRHDMEVVKLAITKPVAVREFEDMRETWNTLFDAFGRRLKVLWEVWRQQRLDLESQVQYYCRGLFRGWHERNRAKMEANSVAYAADSDEIYYVTSSTDSADVEDGDDVASELQSRLRYPVPVEPEDEAGLLLDTRPDWEPVAVSKRKPENMHLQADAALMNKIKDTRRWMRILIQRVESVEELLTELHDRMLKPDDSEQSSDESMRHVVYFSRVVEPSRGSLDKSFHSKLTVLEASQALPKAGQALLKARRSVINGKDEAIIINLVLSVLPSLIVRDLAALEEKHDALLSNFVRLRQAVQGSGLYDARERKTLTDQPFVR
ncbi:uncharacterized protein PHACADRAFT_32038 [Phanerochaete carnosa HHB-10118-sp]|uniref:Uncharacterized protein n=1 Tax=Phanerochaete carnosa (strain HHB-10118-sp) TaxID=650164 RepID=K5WL39_PHACS|nr:uncharacterized protein PHACADRAFT_32038 [Phanerochaete carnosa HHB-10118-sp]EKM50992.1 hypothetical protein PHACADRAFT_32038 [Phanerochaete carnosa HHB-10118-sp]